MKNNRTTALLMLLVFLVVVAVVIIFLTGLDRDSSRRNDNFENVTNTAILETPTPDLPSPDPTTAPTDAPIYYAPSTSAPAETVRPIQTAAPAAPAAPTPTPTPTPVTDENGVVMLPAEDLIPVVPGVNDNKDENGNIVVVPSGTSLGSGSFRSETGVNLNIRADWSAVVSGDSSVDVTVSVYAEHFSLQTTATPGALNLSVDEQYVSLASPAIVQEDNTRTVTLINQHTFKVSLAGGESRDIPVAVEWNFRGSYSGQQLDVIPCGGTITLRR